MNQNSSRALLITIAQMISFFVVPVIAAINIYYAFTIPFTGVIWSDTPSNLYITETFPAVGLDSTTIDSVQAGDLLLEINGAKVNGLDDALPTLQSLSKDSPISLNIFRPSEQLRYNIQVREPDISVNVVREISPTIYVQQVSQDSPLGLAGIRKGDLIIRIDEKEFASTVDFDLSVTLDFVFGWFSKQYTIRSRQADNILLKSQTDEAIKFEVLKNNDINRIDVLLPSFLDVVLPKLRFASISQLDTLWNFLKTNVYSTIVWSLLAFIVGVVLLLLRWQAFGGMLLVFASWACLFVFRKPVDNTFFEVLRDVSTIVPFFMFAILLFPETPRLPGKPYSVRSVIVATVFVFLGSLLLQRWRDVVPLAVDTSNYFSFETLTTKVYGDPVSTGILWAFFFGLDYLLQIYQKKYLPLSQSQALNQQVLGFINANDIHNLTRILNFQHQSGQPGYYGSRLFQLMKWHQKDSDLSATFKARDDIVASDENDFALSFVAISWCEKALPILGFIGTVVGIRVAVDGIAGGINAIALGETIQAVRDDLSRGFEGIGLAFDTTFFGLVFAFIIGVGHMRLKKMMASRLSEVNDKFDQAISMLKTSSVVESLHLLREFQPIVGELHGGSIVELLQEEAKFRQTTRMLIDRLIIEYPGEVFDKARDILLKPVVEFQQIGEDQALARSKYISEQLKSSKWQLACMGIAYSQAAQGVLAVHSNNAKDRLLIFNISGENKHHLVEAAHNFSQLLPSYDLQSILGLTTNYELIHMQLSLANETNPTPQLLSSQPLLLDNKLNEDSKGFLISVNKQDVVVIIHQEKNDFGLGGTLLDVPKFSSLATMPGLASWTIWAEHVASGTLFAVGETYSNKQWRLQKISFQLLQDQKDDSTNSSLRAIFDFEARFPDQCVPKEIFPLTSNQLLILDTRGSLYHWDFNQPKPRLLEHPEWQKRPNDCAIRVGTDGWLAVIVGEQLSMWQVRAGGVLRPYKPKEHRNFLMVKGVEKNSLKPTADGKYLLGIGAERTILATWEFPKYAVDQL